MSERGSAVQRVAEALRAGLAARRHSWGRLSPVARVASVALGAMIVLGVILRVHDIGFPPRFTFDEQHFVPNARRYLLGEADENDHPPLGKLFIAIGMLALGDNSVGWRWASLVLGLHTLIVGYWLARELFQDVRAGWFAAAFIAVDGFFIAYARTALLDGGLTCLVLWSVLAAVTARTWRGVLVCAVLVGLSASVKWSGALVLVPAALAVLLLRRAPRATLGLFAVAPLVHLALWLATFPITHRPGGLRELAVLMIALFKRHLAMGKNHNPLASPWYSWPALYHPIVVKLSDFGARRRYASSAGNPLLFLPATAATLAVVAGAVGFAVSSRVRRAADAWAPTFTSRALFLRALFLLAMGWVALLAPWTVARGTYVFMYHYLPSYGFALVILAGLAARLERRFPRAVAGFIVLVFALALFFAPVWAEFPLSEASANHRLVFPTWRP
jgi:dolichyl-phosphate-mannose-protein mannosyltransferase